MFFELRFKTGFPIAYVVLEEKKYKDDVFVINDESLKNQLENIGYDIRSPLIGYASSLAKKRITEIKRTDTFCAKLFRELYLDNESAQNDREFLEIEYKELPPEVKYKLKAPEIQA